MATSDGPGQGEQDSSALVGLDAPGEPGSAPPDLTGSSAPRMFGGGRSGGRRRGGRKKMTAEERRKVILLSTISTVVVVGIILYILFFAPGSKAFREAFLSPKDFKASAPSIIRAFKVNIEAMILAEILILIFALVLAVLRQLRGPVFMPVRVLAVFYIDIFRSIPILLVLYILDFGMPAVNLPVLSYNPINHQVWGPFVYGVVALVLVYSAYVAEVYRAGIESIHGSQTAGARSLGLTQSQTMRYVVLPQAIRRVIPPLLNDFIGLQKDTALLSVIGVLEAARAAQDYAAVNFNYTSFVVAALLFVIITIPMTRYFDHLLAKDQRRRLAGGVR
jgi:polar amino acid transport system permease protein